MFPVLQIRTHGTAMLMSFVNSPPIDYIKAVKNITFSLLFNSGNIKDRVNELASTEFPYQS